MTEIKPARPELLALAAAVRDPDWASRLDGALTAAATNGWDWPRTATLACRLVFDPAADPRDLLATVRNPLVRSRPAGPTPEYQTARASLAHGAGAL